MKSGYQATALTLPSSDDNPASYSFDDDVALIHAAVARIIKTGQNVVCVLHSYGGVPGSQAMEGLAMRDNPQGRLELFISSISAHG